VDVRSLMVCIMGNTQKMKKDKNSRPPNKKQIEQTAKKLTEAEILALGYEIWDIEYHNDGSEWLLEFTIENPSGAPISFEDCEKVTRAVTPLLDASDPIEGSYCLAVGSPGLNRELKNAAQLERYMGKKVKVALFAKNDAIGDKSFVAALREIGPDKNLFFELADGQNIALAKAEIAHIYAHDEIAI